MGQKRKLGSIAGYGTKSELDGLVDDDFSLPHPVQHAGTMRPQPVKQVDPYAGQQDTEIQNLIDELEIDDDSDADGLNDKNKFSSYGM